MKKLIRKLFGNYRYQCSTAIVREDGAIYEGETGLIWVTDENSFPPTLTKVREKNAGDRDTYTYHLFVRDLKENRVYRAISSFRRLLPESFGITDYKMKI